MQTTGLSIFVDAAPCFCACRYCLLSSDKTAEGVSYARARRTAERFADWSRCADGELKLQFTVGYCSDYPELCDNIAFNRRLGFSGASFLQCNGIRFMDDAALDAFLCGIRYAGVQTVDVTFYGSPAYHDRFAARPGDYDFMLRFTRAAAAKGLVCAPTIPVFEENIGMLGSLYGVLRTFAEPHNIHAFVHDGEGRGARLEHIRLTEQSLDRLPAEIRGAMNPARTKTEKQWLAEGSFPDFTKRTLIVALRQDNIGMLERMTCEETVCYTQGLDDAYYAALPSYSDLAGLYGDPLNTKLYRLRDLYHKWQKRYVSEHGLLLHDVTDERRCGAIRT